jgi:N-acetylglutamate synthase-like GNAT family acetyltransferase
MIAIEPTTSDRDSEGLDRLLWETLWEPIGLPRNIRESFALSGTTLSLTAKDEGVIIGGLVAVWTSAREIEIRHIAVDACRQKHGVGAQLIDSLLKTIAQFRAASVFIPLLVTHRPASFPRWDSHELRELLLNTRT